MVNDNNKLGARRVTRSNPVLGKLLGRNNRIASCRSTTRTFQTEALSFLVTKLVSLAHSIHTYYKLSPRSNARLWLLACAAAGSVLARRLSSLSFWALRRKRASFLFSIDAPTPAASTSAETRPKCMQDGHDAIAAKQGRNCFN